MTTFTIKKNTIEAFQLDGSKFPEFIDWCFDNGFYGWTFEKMTITLPWMVVNEPAFASPGSWIVKRDEDFECWAHEDFHKEFKEMES